MTNINLSSFRQKVNITVPIYVMYSYVIEYQPFSNGSGFFCSIWLFFLHFSIMNHVSIFICVSNTVSLLFNAHRYSFLHFST